MTLQPQFWFIHDGKASYPTIPSIRTAFENDYEVHVGSLDDYARDGAPERAVLLYMMGFYRHRPAALAHLHYYCSPSIQPAAWLKDRVKRYCNFRPDIRLFQSERIRSEFGFSDGTPEIMLPVGVNPVLRDKAKQSAPPATHDFAYIGQVTKERGMDKVIASFRARFGEDSSLLLIGPADQHIQSETASMVNVTLTGSLPQLEAYTCLRGGRVAVGWFPYHRPHAFMTPTKLLEYMALGMPILANDSPMNRHFLERFDYPARVTGTDLFADCPEPDAFAIASPCIAPEIYLDTLIARSGLRDLVDTLVGSKAVLT